MLPQAHVSQTILDSFPATIPIYHVNASNCSQLKDLLEDPPAGVLGVAPQLSEKGLLKAVALATSSHVVLFAVSGVIQRTGRRRATLVDILENLGPTQLVGFGMARTALLLHRGLATRIVGADLNTVFVPRPTNLALVVQKKFSGVQPHMVHALWYDNGDADVCLRAWLSACLAARSTSEIALARKVDTLNLAPAELECLAQQVVNVELLEAEKPTQAENDFENVGFDKFGNLRIRNERFKTRVRASEQTTVVLETACGKQLTAQAVGAIGRSTNIKMGKGSKFQVGTSIKNVRVLGREEATVAEDARDDYVLGVLKGEQSLQRSSFVRMLWFSTKRGRRAAQGSIPLSPQDAAILGRLNDSQRQVAMAMNSAEEPLVIAHGPPGTGKTTTIAAALDRWNACRMPVWVIAQSNVGVKNIARTLAKRGTDFKLLVSKEFHLEWHEHIYEREGLTEHLIRSDVLFGSNPVQLERHLGGSKVLLCTVSMLSNPMLEMNGIFRLVPMQRLVVDEASQIDAFDFAHLFHKFSALEKVCMFGDPNQLPPFGTETAPKMQTIFDFKQFKKSAYFLNTQYRMPIPLGKFISTQVYSSKLQSVHATTAPNCIRFIDVKKGWEKKVGSSWANYEEAHAITTLVRDYYGRSDFCIITPYDSQRALIQKTLKKANLPWENVYNVDSFQGHEAPYVIVSVVRTSRPGFLTSLNRMNVMLTRCERGMVLVTKRSFLERAGERTLLGKLAKHWEKLAPGTMWVNALELSGGRAPLPGAGSVAAGYAPPKPRSRLAASAEAELAARLRGLVLE